MKETILDDACHHVFKIYRDKLSPEYTFHNYQHTVDVVHHCRKIAGAFDLTESDFEILLLAAWFHDTGYINGREEHEEKSKEIAREFLLKNEFDDDRINKVLECIDFTKKDSQPRNTISKIIYDANIADIGLKTYSAKAELYRVELARFGRDFTEVEWLEEQIHFFQEVFFRTEEAQNLYGKQARLNLEKLFEKKNKKIAKEKKKRKKERVKVKDPRRGIQTMFRSIYRNHINLSRIADNKANMMIRINSIIISISLTLVGAKFSFLGTSFKNSQVIIYPIISLLFTALIAIIFAILSANPKVTHNLENLEAMENGEASLLFFGNFSSIPLHDFKSGMREMIKNKDYIYDNMMTDLYYLGKVLTKKYRLVKISYLAFMVGLIITAFITLYVVIYLKRKGTDIIEPLSLGNYILKSRL